METASAASAVPPFNKLETIHGASEASTYVVIAEDSDLRVAIKPEATIVFYDSLRSFFQIGFRIHVRPQDGKALPPRDQTVESLNIGHLSKRDGSRYVGHVRIPVCNPTTSPWVVQERIQKDQLIEQLVNGLFDRLEGSGLATLCDREVLIDLARERFLDMIPDNSKPLPEVRLYFGKESYYEDKTNPANLGASVDEEDGCEGNGGDEEE